MELSKFKTLPEHPDSMGKYCKHLYYRPSESISYLKCTKCRQYYWLDIPKHIPYGQKRKYVSAMLKKYHSGEIESGEIERVEV